MGTRLTGTLVAANLLAVSGLAGLQLFSAVKGLEAHQPPTQASMSLDQPADAEYPLHPVRIVTRNALDGPASPQLASLHPHDSQGDVDADTEIVEIAEDFGLLVTAAGPLSEAPSEIESAEPRLIEPVRNGPEEMQLAALTPETATDSQGDASSQDDPGPQSDLGGGTTYRAKLVEVEPLDVVLPQSVHEAEADSTDERAQMLARIIRADPPSTVGYVVIGSYGSEEIASREAETFDQWQPAIMSADVRGKTYFRVAIGPFDRTDLKPALDAVVADGAKDAWPLVTGQ